MLLWLDDYCTIHVLTTRPFLHPERASLADAHTQPDGILLVSYHFGEGSGTGGLRWNAMARALAERGWKIDVLTLARPRAGADAEAPYAFAPGVMVHPVAQPDWPNAPMRVIQALGELKRKLRPAPPPQAAPSAPAVVRPEELSVWQPGQRFGQYFELINDITAAEHWTGRLIWCRRAVSLGRGLARRNAYRAIIVSSPPHVTQEVGRRLAKATGLPFLPDFRDPWILDNPEIRIEGRLDRYLGQRYEGDVLRAAHTVILNTPRMEAAAKSLPYAPNLRTIAIPNGYDPAPTVAAPDRETFRVAFAGYLYLFMDPRPLFAACQRLRQRTSLPMRIEFMGSNEWFGPVRLADLAAAYGLGDVFQLLPAGTRAEALRLQQAASLLVVMDSPYPFVVPMKFYDHAQCRGTMLLLGGSSGALGDAARQIGLPVNAPDDEAAIDATMDLAYTRWKNGTQDRAIDTAGVFDRRHQVDRLEQVLLELPAATTR